MPRGNWNKQISDERRIGACADWLLGKPIKIIKQKWNISNVTLMIWIKRTGHFKLRKGKRK